MKTSASTSAPAAPRKRSRRATAPVKKSAGRLGLIAGSSVLAAAGLGVLLATRTKLLRRRTTPGERIVGTLTKTPVLFGLGAVIGAGLFRWQMSRLFSEQASYDVETNLGEGDIEIRHYAPQVVAETTIKADSFRDALDAGFETLASYIFGDNTTGEHIEMTTPVTQTCEKSPDVAMEQEGSYLVRFFMPERYTMAMLPSPLNPDVRLRAMPARRVAAVRYTGTFNGADSEQMQLRLLASLKAQGIKTTGEVGFAGYDPPSTLPFLRRNEAWAELASSAPT